MKLRILLLIVALVPSLVSAQTPRQTALPANQSLEMFELHPDLRIELVASEPQVVDPVTATFDHLGRLWVVEMNDYPTGPQPGKAPNGNIKILTDQDGDGFFETVTTFADSLVFPTGITPFRDGVIATIAGRVVYLADTDGDGRSDHREDWFTGFSEDNEQLRANHPTWTLENEIHVASGLRGGEVRAAHPRWPASEQPLLLATRDFRFSPFGGQYRAVAGNSQFGFYQDDSGRNFICSNRNPCRLLLADADQVAGNPLLPLGQWAVDVMPAAEDSQVFPLVEAWTTSNLHAGQFTAACGVYRYQSDWLAPWLANDFFACEPTGSLVQRYRQDRDGIVPQTSRGRAGVEFLASTDPWFRPVDLFDGPDGAMYVVDMHRAVIEHPHWMPQELQSRGDLRWGDNAGRIYRIVPRTAEQRPQPNIDFAAASIAQHVSALASDNRWTRNTAGRRLAEALHPASTAATEADTLQTSVDTLAAAVTDAGSSRAVSRALWLLQSLDRLPAAALVRASTHQDADVRCQVLRLIARSHSESAELQAVKTRLAGDPDPRVRYQWLLEFAPQAEPATVEWLVTAAGRHDSDSATDRQWIARALSLVHADAATALVERLLASGTDRSAAAVEPDVVLPLVRRLGWTGSAETLKLLLDGGDLQQPDSIRSRLLNEFAAGLAQRGRPWASLTSELPEALRQRLQERLQRDRGIVSDHEQPLSERLASLKRVGLDRSSETLALCSALIEHESEELYLEALQVARHFDEPALATVLVNRVVELPPRAAAATVAMLIGNAKWTGALVDALASEAIPWGLIDPASLQRLQGHPDPAIASRVKSLRAGRSSENRDQLLNRYKQALTGSPDLQTGRKLFVQHCSGCHRIDDQGFAVGPDISDLRTQSPEQLLLAILDPNAAIDANYYRYLVLTDDGQVIEGLLEDSNQQSVTLKLQDNVRRTIPRSQLEQLRATGVSMMPEGFENQLSPEAMRDLIGYLKRWRLLTTAIPLGE